jgi:hypothetical protein
LLLVLVLIVIVIVALIWYMNLGNTNNSNNGNGNGNGSGSTPVTSTNTQLLWAQQAFLYRNNLLAQFNVTAGNAPTNGQVVAVNAALTQNATAIGNDFNTNYPTHNVGGSLATLLQNDVNYYNAVINDARTNNATQLSADEAKWVANDNQIVTLLVNNGFDQTTTQNTFNNRRNYLILQLNYHLETLNSTTPNYNNELNAANSSLQNAFAIGNALSV